jgi:hypothetical protein
VTTEHELKLAVVVVVVVVVAVVAPVVVAGAVVGAAALVVVGAVLDDVEGEELHAVRRARGTATTIPTKPGRSIGCSLIRPLGRIGGRYRCPSLVLADRPQAGYQVAHP